MKNYILLFIKSYVLLYFSMMIAFLTISTNDIQGLALHVSKMAAILTTGLMIVQLVFIKITTKSFDFQDVKQDKRIIFKGMTFEQLSNKISHKLKWKLVERKDQRRKFRSPFSGLSYGERIEIIQEEAENPDTLEVRVKSVPIFPLTLFDYAKNVKNIQMIERLV